MPGSDGRLLAHAGALAGAALAGIAARDVLQREHAIVRNFPLVGHLRYLLESFGPELRQYIVTSNDEERPFSRDQRRWVYASSKRQINTFGFGTDNEMEEIDSLVVFKHSPFPVPAPAEGEPGAAPGYDLPTGKVLGAAPVVPSRGGSAGNGECLMTRRLCISSRSLSVPNPNVLISRLDDA